MIDDFIIGGRRCKRMTFHPEDLTFLYPAEIVSRLEALCHAFGISSTDKATALPQSKQLQALQAILNALVPEGAHTKLTRQNYDPLPPQIQSHLRYLINSSLQAAQTLQRTQPDTPLGFPKGHREVLANLLMASWIDLTLGGKLHVDFEPLD